MNKPTVTYAVSANSNKVYAALSTAGQGILNIDVQTTAETLVLLNPFLITGNSEDYDKVISAVKSDSAVSSLASTIESVYVSSTAPLSDDRIKTALADAVKSVLITLQNNNTAAKSTAGKIKTAYYTTGDGANANTVSICPHDMAVLTTKNSSASTVKLELNDVGPGGIKTNVTSVADIVELDTSKISGFNGNIAYITDYDHIENYIKTNGFSKRVVVPGELAGGMLGVALSGDIFGAISEAIYGAVIPDQGITLPNAGVYAIMAYSGSYWGDNNEYNAVKSSSWQTERWRYALAVNIVSIAVDAAGLALDLSNMSDEGVKALKKKIKNEEVLSIYNDIVVNQENLSITTLTFLTKRVFNAIYDLGKQYSLQKVSDSEASLIKSFFDTTLNAISDVYTGSVAVTKIVTRIGNLIFSVTPRESAVAGYGNYSCTTPPTVSSTSPANNAPGVPVNSPITATFSKAMDASTIDTATFMLSNGSSNVAGTVAYSGTTATFTQYSNLAYSTTYTATITTGVKDSDGNTMANNYSWTFTTAAAPGSAPSSPTGVSATAGNGQVTISWNAVSGATSYNIYWSTSTGVTKTTGTKIAGVTSPYTHTGLTNGTTYYYVVTAVNSYGESVESNQASAMPTTAGAGAPGSLDTTFGTGGKVITDFGNNDSASAVAIQSDGKIVAAGGSYGTNDVFAVVRYNSDGSLDTTFGTGGKVTTDFGNNDSASAVAIQSDGKIVAAGGSFNGTSWDFALVRYNTDGSLDTTFGTGGKVTTAIGTSDDYAYAAAIQSDGKIVAAGNSQFNSSVLVRYNTNGSLDTTFGTGGKVTTAIRTGSAVAIQSDGKIVAAGDSSTSDFALVRYNTDGSLDTTFGTGGKVTTAIGTGCDLAFAVAIQSDGRIVAAGYSYNGTNNDFALVRYWP